MKIIVTPLSPNTTRLELSGMLNLQSYFQVEEEILRLVKKTIFNIELDMTKVKHMDYRGVEILVKRAERMRSYGGDLVLHGLSPYLISILQMAGAENTFALGSTTEPVQTDFFNKHQPTK